MQRLVLVHLRTNILLDWSSDLYLQKYYVGYILMQYSEGREMKVGIQYFAKGCLYSFTNPILLSDTKLISFFFLFCFCLYFPSTWRVNITVLSAVNKVLLYSPSPASVWAMFQFAAGMPWTVSSNTDFFSHGRGRILPSFSECCVWEVKMYPSNGLGLIL